MNARKLVYGSLALLALLFAVTHIFGQDLGLDYHNQVAQEPNPNIYFEHVFVNGGGPCTYAVEGRQIILTCKSLPTDIRSRVTLSFTVNPESGAVIDGDLTEVESDGYRSDAHNMFGMTNLPDHLKVGDYLLTANFNGDGWFGDTEQRIHIGRVGKELKVFILHGTTTIDKR